MPHGSLGVDAKDGSLPTLVPSTIAMSNKLATAEEEPVVFTLEGVSSYDQVATLTLVTPPAHGRLARLAGGSALRAGAKVPADTVLVYTPAAEFYGDDAFTYKVDDCCAPSSAPVRVSVAVAEKNEEPKLEA
eukprot:2625656-Pyramimonas_sp.AAC.1